MLLIISGLLTTTSLSRDFPTVGLLQAIQPAINGQPAPAVNPHIPAARLISDRGTTLVVGQVVLGIATLLMAYSLWYLFEAVRARRPETPVVPRVLLITAAPAIAVLGIARQVVINGNAADFAKHATPTEDYASSVYQGGVNHLLGPLTLAGQFALAAAIALISYNAMRIGLLTRFMGVLGIIVAVLFIIPLFGGGLPIVQIVWLGLVAAIFALRWPGGQPKAWLTGQAEPWPSAEEVRRQREASRAHAEAQQIKASPAASEGGDPVKPPHPSSKKRRKRRR